jgi:LysR family glycine cleavage system transcriptional activator
MDAFPPLKTLLAFDSAMKHNSFTKAAQELSVTPGAIGQQIRILETWLGTDLFVRTVRQVQPTASAVSYWADIQPALSRIRLASSSLRNRGSDEVRLSMPPSLAAKWFARRMGRFMTRHPQIVLHLSASTEMTDFARDRAELAIRYFNGSDPRLEATLLCGDEARLYCSPDYAARIELKSPNDLVRATLLHSTMHPHWEAWLNEFSTLTTPQRAALPVQHFDLSLVAIEAARQGQGVVLSSALLTEDEVAQGSLYEPFPCRLPLTNAYYLVHQRGAVLRPAAQQVAQWLLSAS